jgi:ABC-type Fe3+ transport system substrate-binding protein
MKIQIREFNAETGKTIDFEREATAEEIAEFEAEAKAKAERDAAWAIRDADRAALLAKLGITQEEASLLFS